MFQSQKSNKFTLPDTTNVDEINVPPPKKDGGFSPPNIKATAQGKSPLAKDFPFTMNPEGPFDTPQVTVLLFDRFERAEVTAMKQTKKTSFFRRRFISNA